MNQTNHSPRAVASLICEELADAIREEIVEINFMHSPHRSRRAAIILYKHLRRIVADAISEERSIAKAAQMQEVNFLRRILMRHHGLTRPQLLKLIATEREVADYEEQPER